MFGGGDEATEDDRIGALPNERLQFLHHHFEFGICGFDETFCLFNKSGEWAKAVEAGGRLYICSVSLISVVIENLFF